MSDASFHLEIQKNIFAELKRVREDFTSLREKVDDIEDSSKKSFKSLRDQVKTISFVSITEGLENITRSLNDITAPGLKFESAMANLSAITGFTGDKLDELAQKARQSGKDFGEDPAESVKGYEVLLSKLGPAIADDVDALDSMSRSVSTLAKTMGGDTNAAVDALTTGLLQFQVPLENQAEAAEAMNKQMNVMAAASQQGAAAVPKISEALNVAGVAASNANVSFEQTNAAIQELAKGGKEGAEAGTALRNVMGILEQGRFMPKDTLESLKAAGVDVDKLSDKSLSFTDRLRELEKVQTDTALINKMFGRENAAAANILIRSVDAQDELTKKITDTNTAHEMAATVMETSAEKQARLQARIDDFKVSIFNATGGLFAYLTPISDIARQMSALAPIYSVASKGVRAFAKSKLVGAVASKAATAATKLWNLALMANPAVLIATGVIALGAAVYGTIKALKAGTVAQKAHNEVTKEANIQIAKESAELKVLFAQLKKTNPGTAERAELVKKLKEQYPELIGQYDLEKASLKEINELERESIRLMGDKIKASVRMKKAEELLTQAEEMRGKSAFETNNWTEAGKQAEIADLEKAADQLIKEAMHLEKRGKKQSSKSTVDSDIDPTPDPSPTTGGAGAASIPGLSTSAPKNYQGTGSEMKNINVRIDTLVKNITISNTNMQQSMNEIKRQVTEVMTSAVRDFEVAM